MKNVAIVGAGQSTFSRNCGMSIRELCFEAYKEAIEGLNISSKDIGASIICYAPEYDKQRSPAAIISEYLGLIPKPTFSVESVCSSSSSGLRVAWSLVKSEVHDVVIVIGFQKMSELTSREVAEVMGRGDDTMFSSPFGTSMPAGYAMYAQAHMAKYGTTEEDLAMVRVKSSFYGAMNPKATYRKLLSLEEILTSESVCSPLKRFDCCANADGSSCLIVASADKAKRITDKPVWILGLGMGTAELNWSLRSSLTGFDSAKEAARQAYEMAGLGPEDIDIAEVHDCFTIAELIAYEDLGFAKPGEGVKLITEKETYLGGRIPINIDGGLLSKGHPIGATGGSQIRSIVKQLKGEAGEIQVENAKVGLIHNIGGVGTYTNITILGR